MGWRGKKKAAYRHIRWVAALHHSTELLNDLQQYFSLSWESTLLSAFDTVCRLDSGNIQGVCTYTDY